MALIIKQEITLFMPRILYSHYDVKDSNNIFIYKNKAPSCFTSVSWFWLWEDLSGRRLTNIQLMPQTLTKISLVIRRIYTLDVSHSDPHSPVMTMITCSFAIIAFVFNVTSSLFVIAHITVIINNFQGTPLISQSIKIILSIHNDVTFIIGILCP